MKVTIINDQNSLILANKKIEMQVEEILKAEDVKTDEVILNFVTQNTIIDLHKKYFDEPSPTDCISFPIDNPNEEKIGYNVLGEAFICTDIAIKASKEQKTDPYFELVLYIIHCILHLIGYDDINIKDEEIMRQKENIYISLFKKKKIF